MAKIGLLTYVEYSHVRPIMRLVDDLRDRGHDIVAFSTPTLARLFAEHGHRMEAAYPASFDFRREASGGTKSAGQQDEETKNALSGLFGHLTSQVVWEEWRHKIKESGCDLLIADTVVAAGPVLAWSLGIPCLQFCTGLPPDATPPGPAAAEQARRQVAAFFKGREAVPEEIRTAHLRLAKVFGYAPSAFTDPTRTWPGFAATTCERAILCEPALCTDPDLLRRDLFVESLPRPDGESLDPRRIAQSSTVLLCFGSLGRYDHAARQVLGGLLDFFAETPELELLAVAQYDGALPKNVRLETHVDQRELLARGVRLMVTHVGMGTMKECAYYGVPLVAIPVAFDQPMNAAFAQDVGLGRALALDEVDRVAELVRECVADEALRNRAHAISGQVREFEGGCRGADRVLAMLRSGETAV